LAALSKVLANPPTVFDGQQGAEDPPISRRAHALACIIEVARIVCWIGQVLRGVQRLARPAGSARVR